MPCPMHATFRSRSCEAADLGVHGVVAAGLELAPGHQLLAYHCAEAGRRPTCSLHTSPPVSVHEAEQTCS